MASIRLDKITHRFGQTVALDEVSLTVGEGELYFLLGPSGCGKSTLLRIIAGLLTPSAGRIFFGERDVTSLPTQQRQAVMCFQSYALWPHLTVAQNVAFGLEVRRTPAEALRERLDAVLRLVRLDALAARKPNELSGGQQQRVALARALAVSPTCLLLDEPLSNLDAQLRSEMRSEIRRICKSEGLTTVYVTHDQKEALSIADRIAVLKDGRLMQEGSPAELYYGPASEFVASFIGNTNLVRGTVVSHSGAAMVAKTPLGELRCTAAGARFSPGDAVTLSLRPEHLAPGSGENVFSARVAHTLFLGESSEQTLLVGGADAPLELKVLTAIPLQPSAAPQTFHCPAERVIALAK
jgi:iron(III) transport system ATP-binding protein